MRSQFAMYGLDVGEVGRLVKWVYDVLESDDRAAWQRFYDELSGTPFQMRPLQALAHRPSENILKYCSAGLSRDVVPETGEPLAEALRLYVERTAPFALHGHDELRGLLIDQLPGAGLIKEQAHVRERDGLDRLLFAPPGGIDEPFAFLEIQGSTTLSSFLLPDGVCGLLQAEAEGGLFAHLAREAPRVFAGWRDFALIPHFLGLVEAAGLGLYYRE